ncbi:hypothetical protein OGAPHI_005972 [Ogataea philodendri]|uniref:Peptidase M20 dimerisation domain-containing protein n=1 Tax=Ogataea philodendri TaxID=1378263 RepID=A0A9P8NYH8_9ASCO|nr:uncharacterized protein OGAPHI_005972 [Ogataea philodendri]KAH3661794.1 hypothetical protein OGAPHI_005972 [Ogataea philodendri]
MFPSHERHLPLLSQGSSWRLGSNSPDTPPTLEEGNVAGNPIFVHKWANDTSIVCVAASPKRKLLFCGTQDSRIIVYDLQTYQKTREYVAHSGSVLCLLMSDCETQLFSGGADSLVRIWDITDSGELDSAYTVYSPVDIGDIFSIAWWSSAKTIILGAQNASISYVQISLQSHARNSDQMPFKRYDKFFDSTGHGRSRPKAVPEECSTDKLVLGTLIQIPSNNIISYAHNGYIYCMGIVTLDDGIADHSDFTEFLVTGGGDGMVHIWGLKDGIHLLKSLENEDSVLSFARNKGSPYLYCGLANGRVNVWDLSTYQQIRSSESDEGDIVSLAIFGDCLFKGTNSGVTKWKSRGEIKSAWIAHTGFCQAVKTIVIDNIPYLITAGTDHSITLWDISALERSELDRVPDNLTSSGRMLEVLGKLVVFRTVSKLPSLYIDESRRCANYIRTLLRNLGASQVALLPVEDANPVIFGVFKANKHTDKPVSRVLWYGHYDVIEVSHQDSWDTDPFKMTAQNGYLYARGVSDNKGPLLAAVYAVAELYQQGELESDVVFVVEGEEESGSYGFQDVVTQNRELFGDIDWVFLSNSYWLDDNVPCLNYGLRGVISATVEVFSDKPDRHSGVDGGISREPTIDLITLLSKLNDDEGKVNLPGFYAPIRPVSDWELQSYKQITDKINKLRLCDLMAKWRLPSLTIHGVSVSGPNNATVIPRRASASLSIRIVPNQDLEQVKSSLIEYLEQKFASLKTENHLEVRIIHEAEPWLADVNSAANKILLENIAEEWGVDPLLIREGGSIPSIRFLEKTFGCEAVHLPTGQASDNAHLNNERLRVTNLFKTKEILKKTINKLPQKRHDLH